MNRRELLKLGGGLLAFGGVLAHDPGEAHAQTEWTGSCVQYVKSVRPEFKTLKWVDAADLWDLTRNRGAGPRYQSVMVINRWNTGNGKWGHVAIVMQKVGNRVQVVHANWDRPQRVSTGWFTISSDGRSVKYDGWATWYPVRGYVYGAK